eukprot:189445_1
MPKPWVCLCCGLLNSSNNPKCQACWTHCTETESAFMCINCKQIHSDQIFRWTKCNHTYCIKCSANLINKSLSLTNEMPRCIHSKCNQSLNIENGDLFKDLLLKKYQITQNIKLFDRTQHLISGYIRQINTNIPHEVMLSVHDFYNLVYCAKINCYQCKTLGFELLDCKKCNGLGYTEDCKQCDSTGIYKYNIECTKCKSTGDYIFKAPCNKCNNSGIYSGGKCRKCNGTGLYGAYGGRCYNCKGTGNFLANCRKCNGSGTFQKRYDCRMCNGKRLLPKQTRCNNCRGSGYFKMDCKNCYASGKVRWDCYKCHGYKQLLVLHFNKLCNKQSFCNNCQMYYPNNMIFYWSNCNHSYCYQCCAVSKPNGSIVNEIRSGRIPVCFVSKCNQELSVQKLKLVPFDGMVLRCAVSMLEQLIYRKDRFQCVFCMEWHLNVNKILWSNCNHVYGIKCAKMNVDKYLIKEEHLFNSFKGQFIPKCCDAICGQKLQLVDAEKIGISDYQRETMRSLIRKQQTNLDKQGCYVM